MDQEMVTNNSCIVNSPALGKHKRARVDPTAEVCQVAVQAKRIMSTC